MEKFMENLYKSNIILDNIFRNTLKLFLNYFLIVILSFSINDYILFLNIERNVFFAMISVFYATALFINFIRSVEL